MRPLLAFLTLSAACLAAGSIATPAGRAHQIESALQYLDGDLKCEHVITAEEQKPKQCRNDSTLTVGTHWKKGDGGFVPFSGEMREIRMYNRLLSVNEIAALSVCEDPDVKDDPDFSDSVGHTCSWYDGFQRQYGYSACDSSTQAHCPVACGMVSLCPAQDAVEDTNFLLVVFAWPKHLNSEFVLVLHALLQPPQRFGHSHDYEVIAVHVCP